MMRKLCITAVAASACFTSTAALASPYLFTKIADNAGPISTLANPAINAGGDVVFRASLDAGGQVIYRGNGGALTPIADNSATSDYLGFGDPVINASGTVAFSAGRRFVGGSAVFTINGATVGTVAATSGVATPFSTFDSSSLAINGGGLVSFTGSRSGAVGAFAGVAGGTPTTIADSTGPYASFAGFTHVNDGGVVGFQATLDAGGVGVFTGSGGGVTTVADSSGIWNSTLTAPSINAGGFAAFDAGLDAGGTGLFVGNGGAVTTVATTAGPFASFFTTQGQGPSINAAGKIIFRATPDSGPEGFYDGIDPSLNKVIALGDALDGSTVFTLQALQGRMNDSGQFVFFASLNDGRQAIFRADPLPEPGVSVAAIAIAATTNLPRRKRSLRL